MIMFDFGLAFLVAGTFLVLHIIEQTIAWQVFTRPIVVAPIMGLLLGDLRTGLIMGASLEAIYMGISNIGGSVPADPVAASVLSVTMVVVGGVDLEAGVAFALPIGTLMAQLIPLNTPVAAYFVTLFDKWIEKGDTKTFNRWHTLYRVFIARWPHVLVIFVSIALGADKIQGLLSLLPAFVITGLRAAGGILPAIGFAIILKMVWTKDLGAFLIIGFVLAAYLKLDTLAIALMGTAIAVLIFFNDVQKSSLIANNATVSTKEDFFDGK
jgi:mannose/fructose/N-acetylgalactosamine-specific phosphotransferase system component IIC